MSDYLPFLRENWEKNKKYYLFCKCCGLILAPLMEEGYSVEGDFGYCYGCANFFLEKFGFKYKGLRTSGVRGQEFAEWDLLTLKDWEGRR